MKIYFPQWQGSGKGESIEPGAKTILEYLNDKEFVQIPLSDINAGENGEQKYYINNYEALIEQLSRLKKEIKAQNPKIIKTIGGDCGLEIVPVSYLNALYPNLGVIWFDAHADINRPCDSPSCNFHGMPLRTLLGEGEKTMDHLLSSVLTPSQIHYIGLRDIDDTEQNRIDKDQIFILSEKDTTQLVDTLKQKNITHLYLHFDFDCLEPKEYDKTYYRVSDGVTISEAEQHIEMLKKHFTIVGSSLLESITTNLSELKPIETIINELMKD